MSGEKLLRLRMEILARGLLRQAESLRYTAQGKPPKVALGLRSRAAGLENATDALLRELDRTKPPTLAGRVWASVCRRIWRGKGS